jgi:hypothetical protein
MNTKGLRALERALRAEGLRKKLNMKISRRHEFKTPTYHLHTPLMCGFRKFFQTNAEPKMKSLDVMTLMGQDTGLTASYNKPTVDMLLTEYLKAVDNLTINKSYSQQSEIIRNQQTLTIEMQTKDREIQELKEQMSKMQQDFKSYDQMVKATFEHSKELISQKMEKDRKREKAEDERRRILYDMLDRELPGWKSKYYPLIGLESKPLTK